MKSLNITAVFTIAACGVLLAAGPEKMLTLKIGTAWPRALLSNGAPSGNAAFEYGQIVDKKIAFGVSGNFLWNTKAKEESFQGHVRVVNSQKTFMFPIMGFVMLDPLPDLPVHPVAHFKIGYNSMIYSYEEDSSGTTKPLSPYFYGLIMKAGADALYDIGQRSALFLGIEYQWADMKTAADTNELFDKRNMSGIGLTAGFRVLL